MNKVSVFYGIFLLILLFVQITENRDDKSSCIKITNKRKAINALELAKFILENPPNNTEEAEKNFCY